MADADTMTGDEFRAALGQLVEGAKLGGVDVREIAQALDAACVQVAAEAQPPRVPRDAPEDPNREPGREGGEVA